MTKKRMLVFLSAPEKEHFFSGIPHALLESLEVSFELVDPTKVNDCQEILDTVRPEIILGGWDMPPLPLEALAGRGGRVKYLCYLAGKLTRVLNEEHFQEGLLVTNWGKTTAPFVAENALLLILSALRKMAKYGQFLKEIDGWRPRITGNQSLYGKRVGLHGFGTVAQHLVPLLRPFQCEIVADTQVPDSLLFEFGVRRVGSTRELFEKSDVVVELKPLTEKTRGSVTKELLNLMTDGSCFVNVGRGPIVDEEDLLKVAKNRNIQFALDIFADHRLNANSPILQLDNVLLLPQIGGDTTDRGHLCGQLALRNLRNYLNKAPLENVVQAASYTTSF